MNLERIKLLREHLRSDEAKRHFDMGVFLNAPALADDDTWSSVFNRCGTVGCIAGHTMALFAGDAMVHSICGPDCSIVAMAGDLLGLPIERARELFNYISGTGGDCKYDEAMERLDALIDQGVRNHAMLAPVMDLVDA